MAKLTKNMLIISALTIVVGSVAAILLGGAFTTVLPESEEVENVPKESVFNDQLQIISISIQDRGEEPPYGAGKEKFAPGFGTLITAELSSGSVKTLTIEQVNSWLRQDTEIEQTFGYLCGASISPNKQEIAFGLRGPAWNYMAIWNVETDMLKELPGSACGGVWSHGGRYIAYGGGGGAGFPILSVMDLKTGKRLFEALPRKTFFGTYSPNWSPDDEQLFFRKQMDLERGSSPDDPLFVINIDGTGLRQVK